MVRVTLLLSKLRFYFRSNSPVIQVSRGAVFVDNHKYGILSFSTTSQKITNLALCVLVVWILFGNPFLNFFCGHLGS